MSGAIGRRHGGSAAEPRPEGPEPDGGAVVVAMERERGCRGCTPCSALGLLKRLEDESMALRFFTVPVRDSSRRLRAGTQRFSGSAQGRVDRSPLDRPGRQLVLGDLRRLPQPCAWRDRCQPEPVAQPGGLQGRFCLPRNLRSFRSCDRCARNWPRPKPYRSTRCSPTSSWRRWCSGAASPKATWHKSKGLATSKIDKYAERLLPLLLTLGTRQDASSGEPV